MSVLDENLRNSTETSNDEILYDPIMDSLVQSSLAHYVYMKRHNIDDLNYEEGDRDRIINIVQFHPNYIRFHFLDNLSKKKSSVTLGSLKLYDLKPGAAPMDIPKLMERVRQVLESPVLVILMYSFAKKLQVGGNQADRILGFVQTRRKPSHGIGLLYFVLMDLYLEPFESYIFEVLNKSELCRNYFWSRSLNIVLIGFTDKKAAVRFSEVIQLNNLLPAWGLTEKVLSASRAGRVLRPWNGKLYINPEGKLQWKRPESIIDM